MSLRLVAITYDAVRPAEVAAFWSGMLNRPAVEEAGGVLLPGDETQVGLRFVDADTEKTGRERVHLHVTSSSAADQERTVEQALSLGGTHLDVGQRPEEGHIVLADPGGHALCVIEPGNNYLAGCGRLGEVACEGTRAVGLFWSEALGWPLVWDENEETAIQSPQGGTKVAWGGPPLTPKHGRDRQRFDLVADRVSEEVERLVGLGATRLPDLDEGVELADPDGNEFRVRQG